MAHPIGAAERDVLLALADDEHLMGQHHTEWIGVAPFLEEDLAFASIGQDELGHAAMLYEVLDADCDALALRRDPSDYRSCWLAEAACADWASALVRHWLYDEAEVLRWQALATSCVGTLRDVAERALVEEVYHRRHAAALLDALCDDSDARRRLREAVAHLTPLAHAMFEPSPGQDSADPAIVGPSLKSMVGEWSATVSARFGTEPFARAAIDGQQGRTRRSDDFTATYSRMREVLTLDPSAQW